MTKQRPGGNKVQGLAYKNISQGMVCEAMKHQRSFAPTHRLQQDLPEREVAFLHLVNEDRLYAWLLLTDEIYRSFVSGQSRAP